MRGIMLLSGLMVVSITTGSAPPGLISDVVYPPRDTGLLPSPSAPSG